MVDDYVKKIIMVRKLGETLRELGITANWKLIDNIHDRHGIRFFGVNYCKEYVDRFSANGWFPESTQ